MKNSGTRNHIPGTAGRKQKGFALSEMLIYISFISVITVVFINVFISETSVWANARAERNASDAGRLIMERIVQEIKLARSASPASFFGTNPGKLVLDTFESATSTTPSTCEIFLEGQEVKLKRGIQSALLLSGSASVQSLIFYNLTSPYSRAVRISLTVQVTQGHLTKTKTLTTAAVFRGSY